MFDGIIVHVIDMCAAIMVVADHVLPEAALPDAAFALGAV
jgi:hypothetical protein